MLLGALNISLLGHLLSRKGVKVKRVGCTLIRAGDGVNWAEGGTIRTWQEL